MRPRSFLLVAVAALATAAPASAESPHVAGLQVALRAYGFYGGPVDGVRGPATESAIRAFQGKHGLTPDGVAGKQTRKALGKLGAPLFGKRTLARGRVGLDVAGLQFLLARNGLGTTADGYYGEQTAVAVEQFQSRTGLAVDGVAGPATLAALRGSSPARVRRPRSGATSSAPAIR